MLAKVSSPRAIMLGCLLVIAAAPAARAIEVGTTDKFEDNTIMGWAGGTTRTNEPGGPTGPNDRYLRVDSMAGSSAGSKVAFHNGDSRWLGDYRAAGVGGFQCEMRNEGSVALEMRVVLFGLTPLSGMRYTSITSVLLLANSGWQTVTFPVNQSALTKVLGNTAVTYDDLITNVTSLMFRHDPGTPSSGGSSADGTIGVDNIRAIPGPGVAAIALPGVLMLARRRSRRV